MSAGGRSLRDRERRGRCREFVATDHLSVKEARRADRFTQLALVASIEALADAGWARSSPTRRPDWLDDRTGIGGSARSRPTTSRFEHGTSNVSPLAVPLMMATPRPLSACATG